VPSRVVGGDRLGRWPLRSGFPGPRAKRWQLSPSARNIVPGETCAAVPAMGGGCERLRRNGRHDFAHISVILHISTNVDFTVCTLLNIFVRMAQAFHKSPFLRPLAPTRSEPPFLASQLIVMAILVVLGIGAVRQFHPSRPAGASLMQEFQRGHAWNIAGMRKRSVSSASTFAMDRRSCMRRATRDVVAAVDHVLGSLTANPEGDAGDEAQR
jgi:hypothetical protein